MHGANLTIRVVIPQSEEQSCVASPPLSVYCMEKRMKGVIHEEVYLVVMQVQQSAENPHWDRNPSRRVVWSAFGRTKSLLVDLVI